MSALTPVSICAHVACGFRKATRWQYLPSHSPAQPSPEAEVGGLSVELALWPSEPGSGLSNDCMPSVSLVAGASVKIERKQERPLMVSLWCFHNRNSWRRGVCVWGGAVA